MLFVATVDNIGDKNYYLCRANWVASKFGSYRVPKGHSKYAMATADIIGTYSTRDEAYAALDDLLERSGYETY